MPFENNGQMQPPGRNMGEPPEKPQGDFRPQSKSSNIQLITILEEL